MRRRLNGNMRAVQTAQKNYERDQRAKAKTGTWEDEAFAEKTAQLTDNDVTLQLQLEQQELKKKVRRTSRWCHYVFV